MKQEKTFKTARAMDSEAKSKLFKAGFLKKAPAIKGIWHCTECGRKQSVEDRQCLVDDKPVCNDCYSGCIAQHHEAARHRNTPNYGQFS